MQDPYAAQRAIAASVAEQVYAAMTGPMAAPEPDDLAVGPAPTNRIDVYLLQTNTCRTRDGVCAPIPLDEETDQPALAAVATTSPCKASGRIGAAATSSFILVDVAQVTPASTPWNFRYTMALEYFHVLQNAINLEAQGGGCVDDKTADGGSASACPGSCSSSAATTRRTSPSST